MGDRDGANTPDATGIDWLPGGGEMGARIRAYDWSRTSLGPMEEWPQSLRSALGICLDSRFPIVIYWGEEYLLLYNDAWRPVPGTKHPWALGRSAREVWAEIWDIIGPMFERVMRQGEATWSDDQLLPVCRHGYIEEAYFYYSFSPIRGEGGKVEGIFTAVTETTYRVLGERRTRTLRELAEHLTPARSDEEVCALAAQVLAANPKDIPFALLYLLDDAGKLARLGGRAGVPLEAEISRREIGLADPAAPWPLARVLQTGKLEVVPHLEARLEPFRPGPWPEIPHTAVALPIQPAGGSVVGFLVAGVSARRALDEEYHAFFRSAALHVGMAIANARAYEEERKRAEALAEIDRAKTLFFSNVSHEFRTPLTLMLGPVEDMLGKPEGGVLPENRELLTIVQRNARRLQKLVNTLLDFSRIEAGRVQASYEPTDLASLTTELASVFRAAIERAGLKLVLDCERLPEPVFVDPEMWEKVVLNLLSNAFKFTLEGEIVVKVKAAGDRAEFSVRDTGTGIPEQELPHVFDRFHRIEGQRGRTHEGTGIGLALVQELVKLHGGAVRVESVYGRGTTFTVSLPFGVAHLPPERIGAARTQASTALAADAFVDEALQWLPGELERTTAGVGSMDSVTVLPPSTNQLARIVVADDNADMRAYVQRLLRAHYEVEAVEDGEAALAAIHRQRPDLVLTDVMMPRLDGFGLLRELRRDPTTATIPVLMLSARAGEEARIEGVEAGADDYLVKPFSARELLARVSGHLELARVRNEARDILESITDGFIALDHEWRFTYVNSEAERINGRSRSELLGRNHWEVFPATVGTRVDHEFRRAVTEQVTVAFENHYAPWDRWFEVRAFPSREGLSVFFRDITDRKHAEEELRRASQAKDDFLAMLAHELRNPLAPIRTAARLLERRGQTDPVVQRNVAIVERQVRNMARLLDDLLDVSRITRGKITLHKEELDLLTVVHHSIESTRPFIDERGHELLLHLPSEPLLVEGDRVRLEQVVVNLLNNAAKYTDPGGKIEVSAATEGAEAVLRVRDSGRGIQPELLPRVFDLFTQGARDLDRSQGGLGIGLTMVKSLVEMHGGSVEARSDGIDRGAEFIVRLPAVLPRQDEGETGKPEDCPGRERRSALTPSNCRVLVVDDNKDAAETLAELIQLWGHETRTVFDGGTALTVLREYRPHIALLDLGMPRISGYELAASIRADRTLSDVQLVAMTGFGAEEDRQRARQAGFGHHLTKPVEPEAVETLLATLCPPMDNLKASAHHLPG